jgi:hypothetical protein
VADDLDHVARYAMALGFAIRARTVIVEGTTDVDLCQAKVTWAEPEV